MIKDGKCWSSGRGCECRVLVPRPRCHRGSGDRCPTIVALLRPHGVLREAFGQTPAHALVLGRAALLNALRTAIPGSDPLVIYCLLLLQNANETHWSLAAKRRVSMSYQMQKAHKGNTKVELPTTLQPCLPLREFPKPTPR